MKGIDIKKMGVSYFRNFYDKEDIQVCLYDCLVTIPEHFSEQYKQLRAIEDIAWQKKQKLNFPMFVPSAICGKEDNNLVTRKHEYIIRKNNLMAIDIDKSDNPTFPMDILKTAMFKLDYVYCVSKSIRGNGLFAIVVIEDTEKFKEHFAAIEKDFADAGVRIDSQCKDITRARFLSYDPDILIKSDEDEIIPYDKTYSEISDFTRKILEQRYEYNRLRSSVYSEEPGRLKKVVDYYFDNDLFDCSGDYGSWIQEAGRLASLEDKLGYNYCLDKFVYFSERIPGFKSITEAEKKYNSLRAGSIGKDFSGYYFNKVKKYMGRDFSNLIKNFRDK